MDTHSKEVAKCRNNKISDTRHLKADTIFLCICSLYLTKCNAFAGGAQTKTKRKFWKENLHSILTYIFP